MESISTEALKEAVSALMPELLKENLDIEMDIKTTNGFYNESSTSITVRVLYDGEEIATCWDSL